MDLDSLREYKFNFIRTHGERNMIPFNWLPGAWGLKGKAYERAKAEYELEGYELDRRIAEIDYEDSPKELAKRLLEIDLNHKVIDDYEYDLKLVELTHKKNSLDLKTAKLDVDYKHEKITDYEYERSLAELKSNDKEKKLALLEVELKHNHITAQEYERRKADINDEPWISMPKIGWDPDIPSKTYFELDYNDSFVTFLRENGYQGSDDDCINRWLNDVCYSVLEEMNQPELEAINPIKRVRLPDGKTEHS